MKKLGVSVLCVAALAAVAGIEPAHAVPVAPNGSMAISSMGATVSGGGSTDINAGTNLVTLVGPFSLGLFADPYTPAGGPAAANNFCGPGIPANCLAAHTPGYLESGDVVTFSTGPSFPVGNGAPIAIPTETVTITDGANSVGFDFSSAFTQTPPGIVPTGPGAGSFQVVLEGVFASDTAGVYLINGQSASLSLTCTQVNPSAAIGCGISIATPSAVDVPEPASLALLGFGLVGLGWLRRRRAA